MRGRRFDRGFGIGGLLAAIEAVAVLVGWLAVGFVPPAQALPSYARQTGQPCGTCHTDFPALTPYGRRFKLLGYTTGGGPYRTTPFARPSADVGREVGDLADYARGIDNSALPAEKGWVPPISAMA